MPKRSRILAKAIRLAGGVTALAQAIGVKKQSVDKWPQVPAERVLAVEAATRCQVSREELRPDIYPPEKKRRKA